MPTDYLTPLLGIQGYRVVNVEPLAGRGGYRNVRVRMERTREDYTCILRVLKLVEALLYWPSRIPGCRII